VSQSEKRPRLDAIKGVLTKASACRLCLVALNVPNRACLIESARPAAITGIASFWSLKQKNNFFLSQAEYSDAYEDWDDAVGVDRRS